MKKSKPSQTFLNSRNGRITTWSFLVIAVFGSLYFARFFVNRYISGDEPHYILMAQSLKADKDLNLRNNFENNDANAFYPGLPPTRQIGKQQVETNSAKWYSIHGPGVPLLLAAPYIIGGMKGMEAAMVAIATATVFLTYGLTRTVTKNKKASLLTGLALLICYFFNTLAGHIYPDMIIAALTLGGLLIILERPNSKLFQVIFGFIVGFMCLLHFKSLIIIGPLCLALLYETWNSKRKLPWLIAPGLVLTIGYLFFSAYMWFGVWKLPDIYAGLALRHASPWYITSALLFDAQRGLLVNNPLLWLIPVGLPIWYFRNRKALIICLAAIVPSILLLAGFGEWYGGDAPTGRYIIDFLPILMPAIGFVIISLRSTIQRAIVALMYIVTFLISLDFTLIKRQYVRISLRNPLFEQISRVFHVDVDKLLPHFTDMTVITNSYGPAKLAIGYLFILGCFGVGYVLAKPEEFSRRRANLSK